MAVFIVKEQGNYVMMVGELLKLRGQISTKIIAFIFMKDLFINFCIKLFFYIHLALYFYFIYIFLYFVKNKYLWPNGI